MTSPTDDDTRCLALCAVVISVLQSTITRSLHVVLNVVYHAMCVQLPSFPISTVSLSHEHTGEFTAI